MKFQQRTIPMYKLLVNLPSNCFKDILKGFQNQLLYLFIIFNILRKKRMFLYFTVIISDSGYCEMIGDKFVLQGSKFDPHWIISLLWHCTRLNSMEKLDLVVLLFFNYLKYKVYLTLKSALYFLLNNLFSGFLNV